MDKKTKLIDGSIAPFTKCPFLRECEIARGGGCRHQGEEHSVTYSCAAARSFDLSNSYK